MLVPCNVLKDTHAMNYSIIARGPQLKIYEEKGCKNLAGRTVRARGKERVTKEKHGNRF